MAKKVKFNTDPVELEEPEDPEESEDSGEEPLADDKAEGDMPPPPVKHDPLTEIGLDAGSTGTYVFVPAPAGFDKDRRLFIDGVNYEHVADSQEGCWLYRRM